MFSQAQDKIKAEVNTPAPMRRATLRAMRAPGRWSGCGVGLWIGLWAGLWAGSLLSGCGGRATGYAATPPAEAYAWYARAKLLEAQGDIDQAIDAMHRALVSDNGAPALLAETARLLCTHRRDPEQAAALLRMAASTLTPTAAGWLVGVEARVTCAASDAEAAAIVGEGLTRYPGDIQLLRLDAEVALRQGDTDRAYARLTALHQQQPQQPRYAQQLAALDVAYNQPQRALARLSPFLSSAAPEAVFVTAADAHAAAQDPSAAQAVLRACLDVHFQSDACEQRLSDLLTHRASAPQR